MNSKVLIIDTDTVNRSPMLSWWERHKEDILYCDEMEDFDAYIRENVHRGIMVITENDALTQRMRDYSNELDEAAGEHGGLCVGDAEVFNEPRQCIFEGEGLFRSDMPSESAAAENEFLRKYPYKEEDVAGRREAVAEEAASDESSTSEEERGARRPGLIAFKEWLAAQPPDESDSDREWLNDNGDDSDEEAGALGRPGPQVKKQFEEWLVTQPPDQVVGWAALAEAGSSVRREMLAAAKEAVAENAAVERPWLVISDAERAVAKDFLSQPFIERFGDSDEEEEAEDEEEKETQFKKQFEEWLPTQPSDQVGDWAALAAAGPAARREILDWAKETAVAPASDATTAKRGWTRTWTSGPSPERDTATSFLSQPFIAWFDNDPDDFDSTTMRLWLLSAAASSGRRAVAAAWGKATTTMTTSLTMTTRSDDGFGDDGGGGRGRGGEGFRTRIGLW